MGFTSWAFFRLEPLLEPPERLEEPEGFRVLALVFFCVVAMVIKSFQG